VNSRPVLNRNRKSCCYGGVLVLLGVQRCKLASSFIHIHHHHHSSCSLIIIKRTIHVRCIIIAPSLFELRIVRCVLLLWHAALVAALRAPHWHPPCEQFYSLFIVIHASQSASLLSLSPARRSRVGRSSPELTTAIAPSFMLHASCVRRPSSSDQCQLLQVLQQLSC
jgi:hypothetical protein